MMMIEQKAHLIGYGSTLAIITLGFYLLTSCTGCSQWHFETGGGYGQVDTIEKRNYEEKK